MRIIILLLGSVFLVSCGGDKKPIVVQEVSLGGSDGIEAPLRLSDWGLFEELATLKPAENVLPYEVNAPLFSDYAYKARFVSLAEGSQIGYHPSDILELQEGAILVKNFYYPEDFLKNELDRRILETRLLVNESGSWKPYSYIWNEDQTDAELEIAGRTIPISWKDKHGELQRLDYSVPNLNQCKSCHERGGEIVPIGFSARQLNKEIAEINQLRKWHSLGLLKDLPEDEVPKLADWSDKNGALDTRARAWLETNCAHCHRRDGPAKNSGLYLLASEKDQYALGLNKPPVAAGRGSGGMQYAIFPGDPDRSILVHRIESLDPGVMMPELGRKMVHQEGVTLVKEWIRQL